MTIPTKSAKHQMITIIEQQPEDASYDELLRELAFGRMIDRGLTDIEAGRTVDNEDVGREIKSWQK